jgi:predicted DNA-binding WGR domain protein
MDNLLSVTFEAHNDERNHHRRYEVRLGRDLFGQWCVSLIYGRAGRAGQVVRHSGADLDFARKVISDSLRRRLSAPRRLGVSVRRTTAVIAVAAKVA